ncbi:related to serine/threonine-protein kinase STE7 [Zygosaccharomyces bailii]|nr:related to serine/threonine-protein kinase STE7 [Zygosaccharomyces bailii]
MNFQTPSLFHGRTQKKRNLKQLTLPNSMGIQETGNGDANGDIAMGDAPDNNIRLSSSTRLNFPKNDASNLYLRRGFKGKIHLNNTSTPDLKSESRSGSSEGLVPQTFVVSSPTNSSPSTSTSLNHVFTPMDEEISAGLPEGELSKSSLFKNNEASATPSNTIKLEDLVQLGKIGSGNSGTVIKALHVPDSRIIAKKVIPVENNNHLVVNQLVRELTIMKSVHMHDNIVSFYGAYYTHSSNNEIIILMEYMNCGSLDKILSVYKRYYARHARSKVDPWFNGLVISKISHGVLSGLLYLYERYKIIHRDIKPSNVLINSRGQVKICDFGVSKKLINSIADTFVGTSTYMSPERIQGNVYSTKGDVWSLGLVIIELVTGEFPLGGHNDTPDGILDLLQRIVNEPPPKLPQGQGYDFPREMVDFVNRCCVKEESQRSSIQELLCHDFIDMYKYKDKEYKHWCKKVKVSIREDKQIRREDNERAKLEQKQLEKAAEAAATARR